jgi:hypothetical protein
MPRATARIENQSVRVTVFQEGGHVGEILDKQSGINPLWTPSWPSIEPSAYDPARHPEYGANSESKLLAGIMGHNLCLDIFGAPSPDEAAAGLTVHGEAPVARYEITSHGSQLTASTVLPIAQLRFTRRIDLDQNTVAFRETLENLSAADRPIAWTQHVTLGPPFLERGVTQFRYPSVRSRDHETGAEISPAPQPEVFTSAEVSGGFATHLMDPAHEYAWFVAWSPRTKIAFSYRWRRTDFPWLGIWEENHSRTSPPWNAKTLTRGMEFGVSPVPESRRAMIHRGSLFGIPGYGWIGAKRVIEVEYWAKIGRRDRLPEAAEFGF